MARCKLVKLTRYYAKRAVMVGASHAAGVAAELRAAGGAAARTDSNARTNRPFSEFRLATVDGRLIFVLFQ